MQSTAFITGASGGIGSAAAEALAADGCNLCLCYNRAQENALTLAEGIQKKYGVETLAVRCNLTDVTSIDNAVELCRERFGAPDILINNGGADYFGLFQDMTDSELISLMSADLIGAMLLTKRLLPDMIKAKRGYIINISSIWGEVGASCETAYSAAKAGLIGFTRALGKECAPSGVRVNGISPGFIDTEMNSRLSAEERSDIIEQIPTCRAGDPQDIAQAIAFLVSGKADYICGQIIRIDGGWL